MSLFFAIGIFSPLCVLYIFYKTPKTDDGSKAGRDRVFALGKVHLILGVTAGILAFIPNAAINVIFFSHLIEEKTSFMNEFVAIWPLGFYLLVIAAPFTEEFLFRGLLYYDLERIGLGPYWVFLITTSVWLLIHLPRGFSTLISLAIPGIIFGLLRYKTGSIWPCVIAHSVMNFIVFSYYFANNIA